MSSNTVHLETPERNYVAFKTPSSPHPQIGHLDHNSQLIHPLSHASGTPLTTLYEVIEATALSSTTTAIVSSDTDAIHLSNVQLLPPIAGRDILAIGKNYLEHATEFHASGYDSSDKTARPSHPVIFTKRHTSIIASGQAIHPHPLYADTLDYEGEIGVIVSKPGYRVSKRHAWEYIWGFTLINDVTSRNEQRDHKQFFLGKSGDGYCPMGPVAVAKERFRDQQTGEYTRIMFETRVNGDVRQRGDVKDLIFDIPTLIETVSAAQTVRRGDVIATGTPVGVGFGFHPPKWLRPGDEVVIDATACGLGALTNTIADPAGINPATTTVPEESDIPMGNTERTLGAKGLTLLSGKKLLYHRQTGRNNGRPLVCVHGLGGSAEYFYPLTSLLNDTFNCHVVDLEGHGLSPTRADSVLSISSFARDLDAVISHAGLQGGITLIAHSMGCLVALEYASQHPDKIERLVLMGPPPSPLPEQAGHNNRARARTVREKGMLDIVDGIVAAGTSEKTRSERPLSVVAVRQSLLSQDAEGYAKACTALAGSSAETIDVSALKERKVKVLLLTGSEDKIASEPECQAWKRKLGEQAEVRVVEAVGHWHLLEDVEAVTAVVLEGLGVKYQ